MFRGLIALALALLASQPSRADTKAPPPPGREPPATPPEKIKLAKDFKIELLYSVPKEAARLLGQPVCRSQRQADHLRPVRSAVSHHAAPAGAASPPIPGLKSSTCLLRRGPGFTLGLRQSVRDGEQGARNTTPGSIVSVPARETTSSTRSSSCVQAQRRRRAWAARHRAVSRRQVADRRLRQWSEDGGAERVESAALSGAKTTCCRACRTAPASCANVLGPGGCIYRVDPEGKHWELLSTGYRNPFDIAYNRNGDLFTYDADMEWDFNTPWYRPTRLCLAASGSEFGWRNGAGKWPAYYPDSWPAILDIGPGSPTGMTFGYGAKFPAKYQEALLLCDWSYGKLYAVHLTPEGSAYKAVAEDFLSGSPLPLTDVVINPKDGAMYFTIGGRKTKSGLYRLTYAGKESTSLGPADSRGEKEPPCAHKLEAFHNKKDPLAVETAWPHLKDADRYIRSAARVAIEHQEPKTWQERARLKRIPPRRFRRCWHWCASPAPTRSIARKRRRRWTKCSSPGSSGPCRRSSGPP